MSIRKVLMIALCMLMAAAVGCTGSIDAQTTDEETSQTSVAQETTQINGVNEQTPVRSTTEIVLNEQLTGEEVVEEILRNMTIEQKVGQLIVTDYPYKSAGEDAKALMRNIAPGGIAFGKVNFQNAQQTRMLVRELNSFSDLPLIIAVTEEGGRVMRTTAHKIKTTHFPAMWTIGKTGDAELAYKAGQVMGAELMSLGVNLVLAPVADIWSNPENTVIGDRAFGDNPELVSIMVSAMVKGMREQGIGTVLKHFPGHGGTFEDSHTDMTYSDSTLAELNSHEFLPFIAGIEAGSDGVMTAHVVLQNVTADDKPSTVSRFVLTNILREQLSFDGLIVTDAMSMLGMTNYAPVPQASVMAVQAGADVLLIDRFNLTETFDALVAAVQNGEISRERLDSAVRRILMFKYSHKLFDKDYELPNYKKVLGIKAHADLVEEIIARAGD